MKSIIISFSISAVFVGAVFIAAYTMSDAAYEEQLALTRTSLHSSGVSYVLYEREQVVREVALILDESVHNDSTTTAVLGEQVSRDEVMSAELSVPVDGNEENALQAYVSEVKEEVTSVIQRIAPKENSTEKHTFVFDDAVARALFNETNAIRKEHGLPALLPDWSLTHIAESHAMNMAEYDFFAHAYKECALTCRLEENGYDANAWGENISFIKKSDLVTPKKAAALIVESWMKSGGHRDNMLNDTYTHTGVGVAYDGRTLYATSDYTTPR